MEINLQSRQTGQTTRLADAIIQAVYSGKTVIVFDHVPYGHAHQRLFRIIQERLSVEHKHDVRKGRIVFDTDRRIIKLDTSTSKPEIITSELETNDSKSSH